MSDIVIQVENISKQYRLGVLGSGSLKKDLQAFWRKNIGNTSFDPASSIDTIWALKDINFEVQQGDVLGFIGRNGAGKSTLLKIISRIILPTTGSIKGKGRIASLLEVGTGFHPELTGRENIFLNGQILGMKKSEIQLVFDEIVDFSGVEQFIDTPVKRYSSGMYVRLAFAVAAHLNPEILIVDEVLAVGDANFQKKCLGKMKQVSTQEGRTVLFVSHNMQALRSLCKKAICIDHGMLVDQGDSKKVITNYLNREQINYFQQEYQDPSTAPGNNFIRIKKVAVDPQFLTNQSVVDTRTPILINFEFWQGLSSMDLINIRITIFSLSGECIFDIDSKSIELSSKLIRGSCLIPGNFLNDGSYYVSIAFTKNTRQPLFSFEACLSFDVEEFDETKNIMNKRIGFVTPNFPINIAYTD
jgi:lipopolysaccharide transport system ATP-binding protein